MSDEVYPMLATLGEDLILLSRLSKRDSIATPTNLPYALMGSELVRLVAGGYVDIVKGRLLPVSKAGGSERLPNHLLLAEGESLGLITTRTGPVGIEDRALAGLAYAAGRGDHGLKSVSQQFDLTMTAL